ncbi:MAG: hypothetical protein AAF591_07695 [Verrucomicrobiota bacterium]
MRLRHLLKGTMDAGAVGDKRMDRRANVFIVRGVDRGVVFISVLIVCLCAAAVVVWYFARHNPNPRFRPRFGEIVVVSMIAVGLSGGVSFFVSGVLGTGAMFQEDLDLRNLKVDVGTPGGGVKDDDDGKMGDDEEEDDDGPRLPWMKRDRD